VGSSETQVNFYHITRHYTSKNDTLRFHGRKNFITYNFMLASIYAYVSIYTYVSQMVSYILRCDYYVVRSTYYSTSNHATRHTHSLDTTATHPSGKLVNYKRLACYEHCPGTFGYTFVLLVELHPIRIFNGKNWVR